MSRLFGSVRARATLGATLVVAVALVAAGTAVLLSLRSNLLGEAGTQAERSAREVAAELSVGTRYTELSLDVDDRPVQIVDEEGALVAASEDLERISGTGVDAVQPQPTPTPTGDGDGDDDGDDDGGGDSDDDDDDAGDALEPGEIGERTTVSDGSATIDGDTQDYRFAAVPVETRDGDQLTVYAGAPLSAEHGAVNTALTVMLIGFPLLLAVVGWVTWLVTGRALRPVAGIRREMAAITASEDLARRVPVPGTHDEVARLASTTNRTLAALEASVERQRRFVADASHELRSPIASLRTQLEVAAAHPELLDLDGAVEDTVRLQRLAADLLLLARLDAGERPADARVDLGALAREAAEGRTGVTVRGGVEGEDNGDGEGEGDGAGEGAVQVAGSRGQLGRVLANLLDNAQRHARSAVEVSVRRDGDAAVVAVADDGEGVPAQDRERIFERFVRLDAARSRDDGGAGLGLAIARDVAVRHGGTLTVHEAPAGGALFELRLPTARTVTPAGT
ncbi:sensor histidine kinase [Streptomyces sp. NPDC017260]|uniref:sensor histidine kinase n=1 Tax=unclassified Streptomyces TaxID=2593676 RepID=UPI00378985F9